MLLGRRFRAKYPLKPTFYLPSAPLRLLQGVIGDGWLDNGLVEWHSTHKFQLSYDVHKDLHEETIGFSRE